MKLLLFLGFDPQEIAGIRLSESFERVTCSLLELETIKPILQNVSWVLINLDALSRTHPFNESALRKWREVFADLVQKSVAADGRYAQLVGVADAPDWKLAELGISVGVRDLVLLQNLEARVTQSSDRPNVTPGETPANILPFRDPRSPFPRESKEPVPGIPLSQIPVPIRGLEGQSKAVEALRNLIRKCAPTGSTLLISGETGVGKEHIARAIHDNSLQAGQSFRVLHCSELTENNFATKFQAGDPSRPGSYLIDQVEGLAVPLQSRLAAFLMGLSDQAEASLRPRILVTTQMDLKKLCEKGGFREDLYFRINVIEIAIPPLRMRRGDLEDLTDSLLARIARRNQQRRLALSRATFEKLLHYEWPGNIRELENVLEHASLSAWSRETAEVNPIDLPEHIQSAEMSSTPQKDSLKEAVRRFEKEHIAKTLARFGGSKEVTAQALGMSLASLYRKLGNGG
jgi:transcriptional regulator with AAA-type ATPase domain